MGKIFYRSSKILGIIGVIIGSFMAIRYGLRALNQSPEEKLLFGFILSSIVALIALWRGRCRKCTQPTETIPTKSADTEDDIIVSHRSYADEDEQRDPANITCDTHDSTYTTCDITVADETTEDDLKKIEGIGPVLEKYLKKHGFKTFADIANAKPSDIKAVLDQKKKFAVHTPDTRPKQAKLCAEAQRDKLAVLQNKLKGGRKA
ncbi:MAG: hypothetical protein CSA81_13625 [Acidobacteria bacterium]|nr:MAG: hypothetical protein CSA81_13625 [Acidobacteriota bacterium]